MTVPTALVDALASRYRIERELGQGGMATVWLAYDLRHDRRIAIKVLRPELAAVIGAERFLTEIRTTANLQHPHILGLIDSGEAGGQLWYAMPWVEGESLRDRVSREKQLPVIDAVRLAREVASALDYAHRHGVIHRDIKPENILLHDGSALVADFGIALAASRAGDGTRMTETGMSLGTPHYMSPEQAMGERDLDARTDVYALGAVTYEMLAGEPPFTGPTAQAIVARVVTEEPRPLSTQRRTVPPGVEAAVLTALNKLPADRFASAAEFARALEEPGWATTARLRTTSHPAIQPSSRRLVAALAATALALAALAAWGWLRGPGAASEPVSAFPIRLGPPDAGRNYLNAGVALSPDGRTLVYADSVGPPSAADGIPALQFFMKSREEASGRPIAGGANGVAPFFSPDGRWIAYSALNVGLAKLSLAGGSPVVLSDSGGSFRSGAWLDDGSIVFPDRGGARLLLVADSGGPVRRLTTADSLGRLVLSASPLPDSRGALFEACVGFVVCAQAETWVYDHQSRAVRRLLQGAARAHYLPGGWLAYSQADGTLSAVRFDVRSLSVSGDPVLLRAGLATDGVRGGLVISRDGGTLLYSAGEVRPDPNLLPDLVMVDRSGRVTLIPGADTLRVNGNGGINLSPDGRALAFDREDPATARSDVYVKSLPDGPVSRLTFEGTQNIRPSWSPDGRRMLWVSDRSGIQELWGQRADGSGKAEKVFGEKRPVFDGRWSADGNWLIYRTDDLAPGAGDILALNLRDSTTVVVADSRFEETGPELSPDGRWIAFCSNRTGRKEVYVRPFPNVEDGLWQVSSNGGIEPRWREDGSELYYWNDADEMIAARVAFSPVFTILGQSALFRGPYNQNDDSHFFDVMADGRFIALRFSEADSAAAAQGDHGEPVLVQGWGTEVRRLLPK